MGINSHFDHVGLFGSKIGVVLLGLMCSLLTPAVHSAARLNSGAIMVADDELVDAATNRRLVMQADGNLVRKGKDLDLAELCDSQGRLLIRARVPKLAAGVTKAMTCRRSDQLDPPSVTSTLSPQQASQTGQMRWATGMVAGFLCQSGGQNKRSRQTVPDREESRRGRGRGHRHGRH